MEQINVMNELLKIAFEALRKQAFSVLLLVIACGVMGHEIIDLRIDLKLLQADNISCNVERATLKAEFDAWRKQTETKQDAPTVPATGKHR